ncbi:MAG: response regulator [Proteobacteria bacterium]|nr:response regulator [Pseudomonadota bacterium]
MSIEELILLGTLILLASGILVFTHQISKKVSKNALVYYSKLKALIKLLEIKVDKLTDDNEINQYYKIKQIELQAIFDNSPVGIITFDAKGNCINTNTKYQILSGRTNFENLGDGWILSVHEEDREEVFSKWRKFVKEQEAFKIRYRIQANDKSVVRVETITSLVKDSNKVFGFICSIIDINDIWAKSEELKSAKETAEKAISLKNEFLVNLSHEVGNPMNAIIGLTNLTLQSEISEENKENLQAVISSAQELWKTINGLLEYSKIESGKIELVENDFSIRNCIEKTVQHHLSDIHDKGVSYTLNVESEIPAILIGDQLKLSNVLSQIISNSIKFSKFKGHIQIEVTKKALTQDSITLNFSVQDNGVGISKEIIEHIFTPFSLNKKNYLSQGAGLGLAITKSLVDILGGEISVNSLAGMGTHISFTTTFKLSDFQTNESNKQSVLDKPILSVSSDDFQNPISVLLVEDNKINQKIAVRTLTKWGHHCVVANNGQEALELIKNSSVDNFDIILMDCLMPEMDGFMSARNIRKFESENNHSAIPIIAFTASTMQWEQHKCFEAGMNDYIPKPFNQQQLADILRNWGYRNKKE